MKWLYKQLQDTTKLDKNTKNSQFQRLGHNINKWKWIGWKENYKMQSVYLYMPKMENLIIPCFTFVKMGRTRYGRPQNWENKAIPETKGYYDPRKKQTWADNQIYSKKIQHFLYILSLRQSRLVCFEDRRYIYDKFRFTFLWFQFLICTMMGKSPLSRELESHDFLLFLPLPYCFSSVWLIIIIIIGKVAGRNGCLEFLDIILCFSHGASHFDSRSLHQSIHIPLFLAQWVLFVESRVCIYWKEKVVKCNYKNI